jgi:hypothetical protein
MRGIHQGLAVAGLCAWSVAATAENPFDKLLATLPVLDGRVPTYYSGFGETQARQVQATFEAAADYYTEQTGTALTLQLALLGADERQRLTPSEAMSLSIPGVRPGPPYIAAIPIGRQNAILPLVTEVGTRTSVLREFGLTEEQLAQRFLILLALHDVGHYYARAAFPSQGAPPPGWLSEFVASYLATTFLSEKHPDDVRIWRTLTAAFPEHLRPRSRATFDGDFHAASTADIYMCYLGSLQARVNEVHGREGTAFLQKLRAAWKEGAPEDADSAMRLLDHFSPGFEGWAALHHRRQWF